MDNKPVPLRVLMTNAPLDKVVKKGKEVLRRVLIWYTKRLPEPTRENIVYHNTHILMDVRDEFFKHEDNLGRKDQFKAIFKIVITELEHDPYYHQRLNWIKKELDKREDWEELPLPVGCWRLDESPL